MLLFSAFFLLIRCLPVRNTNVFITAAPDKMDTAGPTGEFVPHTQSALTPWMNWSGNRRVA